MSLKPSDPTKAKSETGFAAPSGMHDIWGGEWVFWDRLFKEARKFSEFYSFQKIETPLLEAAELITRAAGETTNLIEKELYLFDSKAGENLALRPEGTLGIARAYTEHKMSRSAPFQKFWYEGPMFREDRREAGQYRQFHQLGFEIVGGPNDPFNDAQVILIFWKLFEELKLKQISLSINSVGCKICRPIYIRQLQNYYKNHLKELCADCERRFRVNPLRLLDCEQVHCVELKIEAPNFFDKLCSPCSAHFRTVLEYLDELQVPYLLNNFLIRDLDYYSRTVFEFSVEGSDEFKVLAAGGRYDYLFELLGMKPTPAVGSAMIMERVIAAMKAQDITLPPKPEKRVFIIHVGELAKKKLLGIIENLREAGIQVSEALSRESLQAQIQMSSHEDNRLALILGQKEVFEESIIVRDLRRGTQEAVPQSRLVEEIRKRLK